jgi:hypothetical protein
MLCGFKENLMFVRGLFFYLLLFSSSLFAYAGMGDGSLLKKRGTIAMTQSHIVMLQTDAETLWGNYYFAVQNTDEKEQEFSVSLRLPRESVDFQAGEGLSNEQITISDEGLLNIHKSYKPGMSLQGVQFKVPVKKDTKNVLSFEPVQDVAVLYFATQQSDLLHFSSERFEPGIPPMLEGGKFSGIRGENIVKGQLIKLSITGFPGDRFVFFILGLAVAALLFLLASLLVWRTRESDSSSF